MSDVDLKLRSGLPMFEGGRKELEEAESERGAN